MSESDKLLSTIEACVGALASSRKDGVLSLGRLIQAAYKNEFFEQFAGEWKTLRDKGKISDEYASSNSCRNSFAQVGGYVDTDQVDESVADLLKSIFLSAAKRSDTSGVVHFYLDISKSLSRGEIDVLLACYKLCGSLENGSLPGDAHYIEWCEVIAGDSALSHVELVIIYADLLIEKKLLSTGQTASGNVIIKKNHAGLSNLGYALMSYVDKAIDV